MEEEERRKTKSKITSPVNAQSRLHTHVTLCPSLSLFDVQHISCSQGVCVSTFLYSLSAPATQGSEPHLLPFLVLSLSLVSHVVHSFLPRTVRTCLCKHSKNTHLSLSLSLSLTHRG